MLGLLCASLAVIVSVCSLTTVVVNYRVKYLKGPTQCIVQYSLSLSV